MIQWASLMVNGKESACQRSRQVQSLGWEDALEKEMAIHSSILAWRAPWTEGTGGYNSRCCKELDKTERPTLFTFSQLF